MKTEYRHHRARRRLAQAKAAERIARQRLDVLLGVAEECGAGYTAPQQAELWQRIDEARAVVTAAQMAVRTAARTLSRLGASK